MKTKYNYTKTEIARASGVEEYHFESHTFESHGEDLAAITVWHFEEKREERKITESITFWLEEEKLDEIIKDLTATRKKLRAAKAAKAALANSVEACEIARLMEMIPACAPTIRINNRAFCKTCGKMISESYAHISGGYCHKCAGAN